VGGVRGVCVCVWEESDRGFHEAIDSIRKSVPTFEWQKATVTQEKSTGFCRMVGK